MTINERSILLIYLLFILIIFTSCKKAPLITEQIHKSILFDKENYKYVEVGNGLKMAYLDFGEKNDRTILLLHGEPNYSFVYRNIAPRLVESGYRVIIPDLIGFGFSSKPNDEALITYSNHTKWVSNFIEILNLNYMRLFAHDWGAMISLRIIADEPDLFEKVAISYGYLFEGKDELPESFKNFRSYAKNDSSFSAGNIMNWGSNRKLPDSIKLKYDLPFLTKSDYYAVRKFPSLIPSNTHDKEAIINQRLNQKLKSFEKPFITIWGNHKDSMWMGKDSLLQMNILGARNQKHFTLESNHFIQEDQPKELTKILLNFFEGN